MFGRIQFWMTFFGHIFENDLECDSLTASTKRGMSMFNYSEWTPSPRRRNRGGRSIAIIVAALCLLVAVVVVAGPWRSRITGTAQPVPTATPAPVTLAGQLSEG